MDSAKIELVKLVIEVFKAVSALIVSILVIYFVQAPSSFLNKEKTEEDIMRERAILLIDIIKMEDPNKRSQAASILLQAYKGKDQDILDVIGKMVIETADLKLATDNMKSSIEGDLDGEGAGSFSSEIDLKDKCERWFRELKDLKILHVEANVKAELEATEGLEGRLPGVGPVARALIAQARETELNMKELSMKIEQLCPTSFPSAIGR